jgi:hypothetical protein
MFNQLFLRNDWRFTWNFFDSLESRAERSPCQQDRINKKTWKAHNVRFAGCVNFAGGTGETKVEGPGPDADTVENGRREDKKTTNKYSNDAICDEAGGGGVG